MPIENSLSFLGLQTSPNNLGAGEKGALVVADNVTIRYPDVLEPRRGQAIAPITLEDPAAVKQVFFFGDNVFVHTAADKVQRQDALVALTGDYTPAQADLRLKTAIAASTLYMATDKGVMALEEATSTTPRLSGIAEPLAPTAAVVEDPTSPAPTILGFLDPGKAVAYRVLFGYVDANKAVHLGPPSVRVTVKNTSAGQASVTVIVPLLTVPTDANEAIVEGTFVRLYRSVMADTEGATSPELYLVNETVIDTTVYGLGDVLILADTAEQDFAVQSAPLYTNPTQGGLPNDPPPFARDLATWSEREWYANTEQPYELTAQLIGVEGGGNPDIPATGLRIGDTVTIAGVTFTAWDETIFAERKFLLWTAGPDAATNISKTLYWLALTVNQWAIDNPTTFKIRAYLEPVVFSDQLLNFRIRFQRPSVDSTVNTAFSVDYDVLQNAAVVTSVGGGYYQVQTTTDNNVLVDDWVRLFDGQDYDYGTFKVTNVLSSTLFEIQSASALVVNADIVFRAYGDSVWTPDLSAGVEADNERRQNGLYYSLPDEPEAVSAANYLTVGTSGKPIRRIIPQRDRLLVFKDEGTYAVYGDFPYQVTLVDDTVAILAPDSATAIGSTVIVLTEDGIMAVSDGGIRMISRPIDSTLKPYGAADYRATTATGAFGVAYESEKVFALFMPALGITGYTAKAYVYGLETDAWTTWSFTQPRLCGRIDPFSDTAYYGATLEPFLLKDRNTSSIEDYVDEFDEAITSTVQWAATTLGAPYATKQAREIHTHFRDVRKKAIDGIVWTDAKLNTDIVPSGESFFPFTEDTPGFSSASTIGPSVLPIQFRTLVPQSSQRAAYYTLRVVFYVFKAYWALNGYSIVFEGTSERTGTVR